MVVVGVQQRWTPVFNCDVVVDVWPFSTVTFHHFRRTWFLQRGWRHGRSWTSAFEDVAMATTTWKHSVLRTGFKCNDVVIYNFKDGAYVSTVVEVVVAWGGGGGWTLGDPVGWLVGWWPSQAKREHWRGELLCKHSTTGLGLYGGSRECDRRPRRASHLIRQPWHGEFYRGWGRHRCEWGNLQLLRPNHWGCRRKQQRSRDPRERGMGWNQRGRSAQQLKHKNWGSSEHEPKLIVPGNRDEL